MSTCLLASIIGRSGPAFSQNTGWLADKIPDKRIYGRFLENGAISVDPTRSFTQQLTRSDICVSDEGHPHFYVWRPLDWPACEHVFFCPGFFVLRVRVWHCETPSLTAETKIELRSSKNLLQKRTPRSGFTIETQRKIPQKKPNSNGSIGFHPRQPVVVFCVWICWREGCTTTKPIRPRKGNRRQQFGERWHRFFSKCQKKWDGLRDKERSCSNCQVYDFDQSKSVPLCECVALRNTGVHLSSLSEKGKVVGR